MLETCCGMLRHVGGPHGKNAFGWVCLLPGTINDSSQILVLLAIHWAYGWLRHVSTCRKLEDREDWPVCELNVERRPDEADLTDTAVSFVGQFHVEEIGPLMHGTDGGKDVGEILTTAGRVGKLVNG